MILMVINNKNNHGIKASISTEWLFTWLAIKNYIKNYYLNEN